MPNGITVAGDVFQCKLDQYFGQIRNVIVIVDDIKIEGKKTNHSNHDLASKTLIETARKCNMHLNYGQLQYKKQEVDFIGETYTTSCSKLAQSKVSAITAMPAPTRKKQVQSFIGKINYLSKFSVQFSELARPIRELSKEKVPFNWQPEHQSAFTMMKKYIAKAPIVAYYNPRKQTNLQTNASIKGLGHACCKMRDQSTLPVKL